jgi:hypothetical protein
MSGTDQRRPSLHNMLAQNQTPPAHVSGVFAHLQDLEYTSIDPVDASLFAIAFSLSGDPSPDRHPANISDDGSEIWNRLLASKPYATQTQGKSSIQKWAICTRMFLDLCHRKNVTPFRVARKKAVSLDALTKEYARSRSLCSSLEQQISKNMIEEHMIESVDRGVFRFRGVEYKDKRFVIVLETKWRTKSADPKRVPQYLKRHQHFEKQEGRPGVRCQVTPLAELVVRTPRFPDMVVQMRLSFSKDKLSALGIDVGKASTMSEQFHVVAQSWARTHRFASLGAVTKQKVG